MKQFWAVLSMTLGTILFVFILFEAMRDVLALLVSKSAGILDVAMGLTLLVPFLISFAMPMALLVSIILVVSRLSNENELTAM
ncbi:LptF/LptG family permease, partial [Verrucomicrobia bacterium]|nr:LptF/LptG family permease [Verrucomicrobiota bacterium]